MARTALLRLAAWMLPLIASAQSGKTPYLAVARARGLTPTFSPAAFPGANAFTVVAVTFMVEHLGMNSTEVGIIFLITLVSALPGSKLGETISRKTSPVTSWYDRAQVPCRSHASLIRS